MRESREPKQQQKATETARKETETDRRKDKAYMRVCDNAQQLTEAAIRACFVHNI